MEYTPENLEEAILSFYRSGQQTETHQWLNEAQHSTQAWSFIWDLLKPDVTIVVQYFAASTLHIKLLKSWNEVPVDHYEWLKKKILEAIINFASGPSIVLNRLCISLCVFIIRTLPVFWTNAFEELVASFQPQHLPNLDPEKVISILLEILTEVPEEFQTIVLSVTQRKNVRTILQNVSKDIVKVIEMCLNPLPIVGFNMSNINTYVNASRCASAWIRLGGMNIDECTLIMQILIDLTSFVYWNKSEPEGLSPEEMELMEVTIEALTAVIELPQTYKYKTYVNEFTVSMLFKFQKILMAEKVSPEPNKEVLSNLYGLIMSLADNQSRLFLENLQSDNIEVQNISFDIYKSVLECSSLPGFYPVDETASILAFPFWYTLQEDVLSASSLESAKLLLQIKPFYRELVCILLIKSTCPLDPTTWSEDDREVFRCYRQDIADTFVYCYNVLNLEMLDILHTKLTESLVRDVIQWNEVETSLHAYSSVAECIEMENLYLPKLMNLIKDIPYDNLNIKVLESALDSVGSYHEWIVGHPEVLESILPFLISALNKYEVATSATMALKDITNTCQQYIIPYADPILLQAQSVLASGMLKLAENRRLMYSIGKVISVLPASKAMDYLNVILAPSFEELQKLVSFGASPSVKVSLVTRLKILTTLYSSMNVKLEEGNRTTPVLVILQSTMPIYRAIGEQYYDDLEVMEDLGSLFKSAVTSLMDDCKPLINDILLLIVMVYKKWPQSHILDTAKTIIIMFSRDEDVVPITLQAVTEIVIVTLEMCSQYNDINMLSEKSDVMEGFFSLLSQLMKKSPRHIFKNNIDTASLFHCAILTFSLPEIHTLRACSSFLVNFITQSRDLEQADVIQNFGENLVLQLLLTLGTNAPRHCLEYFADILLALNRKYCDNLCRWLNQLLGQENFPSNMIKDTQKQIFIKAVLREKGNRKKLVELVLDFTLVCRGILRDTSHP
ncbi:hypothetical protein WA026_017206 [Henosepilachna vigintioctopunctata]|uniref:Importin-13 n=1 Tax=Henosepilachna vigintioctopunctata TaxID=420089 RepID=A0AAW1UF91_9CUCU